MHPYRTPSPPRDRGGSACASLQPSLLAWIVAALIGAGLAATVVCEGGCSGVQRPALTDQQRARMAVEAAAHVVAALDGTVARRIATEAGEPHEPGAITARWEGPVLALELTRGALLAAEGAIDHGTACGAADAVQAAWRALVAIPPTLPPGATLGATWGPITDALAGSMATLARGCPSDGGR